MDEMGWNITSEYLILINGETVVKLYTPHNDWRTSFAMMVSQVEQIRDTIEHLKVVEYTNEKKPIDLLSNEWERLEYNGKKIVLDYDHRIIHNEFEEGNG